jgi:Fe-Mn family superoxide dismutase
MTAFESPADLKPLPFGPARLDGLSERLLRSHWENNYGGSVRALTAVKQQLLQAQENKDLPPYVYNEIKREHLLRTGSVVLHELYFANLGGSGRADEKSKRAIAASFGTFDAWEAEFRRIGAGLGGGSGWVVLGYNTHLQQLENYWLADHAHAPIAAKPILVMDMYEHSYQMDYGAGSQQVSKNVCISASGCLSVWLLWAVSAEDEFAGWVWSAVAPKYYFCLTFGSQSALRPRDTKRR